MDEEREPSLEPDGDMRSNAMVKTVVLDSGLGFAELWIVMPIEKFI